MSLHLIYLFISGQIRLDVGREPLPSREITSNIEHLLISERSSIISDCGMLQINGASLRVNLCHAFADGVDPVQAELR